MPSLSDGLDLVEQFLSLGKELAKLPAMVLPEYQAAAADLFEICKKILDANEKQARWLHNFRYFDFRDPDAYSKFNVLVQEYRNLRGNAIQYFKFSCHDINQIYHRHISSKIGKWFASPNKQEEAEGIFSQLTDADLEMADYLQNNVLKRIEDFLNEVESAVDMGNFEDAERSRLKFKSDTQDIVRYLEDSTAALSDLVLRFASVARVPLTIGS